MSNGLSTLFRRSMLALATLLAAVSTHGATTDLATAPLVTSSTSSVLPNILFVLDDSGSMGWNYLPDWANDNVNGSGVVSTYPYLFQNSSYNGVAYNPAITYLPPTFFTSGGAADTTTYRSMTGVSTTTGGDSSATSGAPNWNSVPNDGYGIQSTSTSSLQGSARYWTLVPGEYCSAASLRGCNAQTAASSSYPYPAYLRWCNSTALTSCEATWISGSYTKPRMASPTTTTITVGGSGSTSVTSVTVDSVELLSATTAASTSTSTVASRLADSINNGTTGYGAIVSGSTLTLYAPTNVTSTPVITKTPTTGSMSLTTAAFAKGAIYGSTTVPGTNILTVISSGRNSYVYPGTAAKATTRTDCAGTTCTYKEEMANYANWWAYYHTRMQMMKSSASAAFAPIGSSYRVGYITIDKPGSSNLHFLNIKTFDAAAKYAWYQKFFAANPSPYTPLRGALSRAGRLFAGKLNGTTIDGTTVTDPMQYSCQQNFTILSTDGYWNTNDETSSYGPLQLDGTTAVGNQDGVEPRPYNDGTSVTYSRSTSQLQQSQTQALQSTSQLQSRTTQIQSSTSTLQKQVSQRQQDVGVLQSQTSQLRAVNAHLQARTSSNSGASYGAWSDVNSCTYDTNGSSRVQCRYNPTPISTLGVSTCTANATTNTNNNTVWTGPTATACNTVVTSSYTNASSCTVTTTPNSSGNTTQCQYSWSTVGTASCSSPADVAGDYSNATVYRNCQTVVTTPYANAASCTATATPDASGNTTQCQYTAWTAWANASSCTALAQSAASPYAVGTATQCQTTDPGWANAGSCSASAAGGQIITCQTLTTGPTPVASCVPQTATANLWLQITCATNTIATGVGVASCTADAPTAANSYVSTNCNTVTTGPTASATCTAAAAAAANSYTATTCVVSSSAGGTSDTLADVAEYYYVTDLRTSALGNCTGAVVAPATTGNDVCTNDVPNSGQDAASWQHMTTFTLGLGASGYMQFAPSYASATIGDYSDVKKGSTANLAGGICSWEIDGAPCDWPVPASDAQTNIDDLWHAAVNGRGTYFSATNPATLSAGLSSALAGVSARLGASAAATTSNPNVTSGDNFVFSSTFTTLEWSGQLYRQQIDLTTGGVPTFDATNTATYDWAAQAQLDANASRTIYTFDATTATKLKAFTWASLSSAEQNYFNTANISTLSQFCASGVTCLSSADQTAATGANLVAFLRGDRTHEGVSTDTSTYYRQRTHVLGDIVNAEAVYAKTSLFEYADAGYSSFKTTNATRQGMVYGAANDGMLHAFNSDTGAEAWTYVPSLMLPNLYKLADKNYSALHQYFVDGTPVASDVYFGGAWHTLLVGGMNRGGRGYYALDITDPAAPKALWEYSETNMGYTYGNPEITKLADGTWVVLVTSGYNNVSPGDGVGRLYVLRADTGVLIRTISTGVGDTTTPSGLARIRAWVDNATSDNTALRAYGGDMLGNLWRFDLNNNIGASGYDAQLLTTFYSNAAGTTRQPITTKPELGDVSGYAVIYVGTGRYMGTSDLTDTSSQSFYAVKDSLGATTLAHPRSSGSGFIHQTLTTGTCPGGTPTTICTTGQVTRTGSSSAVNFATDNGWYIDLPDSGERSNTDPTLALGTLGFTTNVPNVSACTAGGYSFRYFLDYRTGAPVSTSTTGVVGVKLNNALATRAVFVRLPNNTIVQLTRMSDGSTMTTNVPIGAGSGTTRRVSWRELVGE